MGWPHPIGLTLFKKRRSLPCPSFSNVSLQPSLLLQSSFLVIYSRWEHRPLLSTWFSVTARMALGCSRTADQDKALRGNLDRGHRHSLRQQRRLLTSTRMASAAAQISNIHMALGAQIGHGHQHRPWPQWGISTLSTHRPPKSNILNRKASKGRLKKCHKDTEVLLPTIDGMGVGGLSSI